jgi:hypothetical protein
MRKDLPEKLERGRVRTGRMGSDADYGPYGMFFVHGPCGRDLTIIANGADQDSENWEHVSVSTPGRPPNWQEMCFVKDLFWDPEEVVMQLHPARSEYVNNHPHCLHLWRPLNATIPTPPSLLVGHKDAGPLDPATTRVTPGGLLIKV